MVETIVAGQTLLLKLDTSQGALGDVTVTFPAPTGPQAGTVLPNQGALQVRAFSGAASLAPGTYALPVVAVVGGVSVSGTLTLTVVAASGGGPARDWSLSCGPPRTGISDGSSTLYSTVGGFVHIKINSCTDNATGAPAPYTGYGVEIGLSQARAADAAWQSASWLSRPALTPPDGTEGDYARLAVLVRGYYFVFVRIAGSVVAYAGVLRIY